jgi:murein tripeptide amidase MpaA
MLSRYFNVDYRFFTYQNVLDVMNAIAKQFPEVSRLATIGKSVEDRDMLVLTLGEQITKNEKEQGNSNPPSIFMTSVHHAREVLGVTMNIYVILKLLHGYVHKTEGTVSLLRMHNIYSLPLVNVDGYALISSTWENQHTFVYVRKNRKVDGG